ncbi:MAG: arsenate reductase ArsC [Bacteroidota bacterium]
MKKRILILCTGNSARSQIAEGLFRTLGGEDFEVHSAGTHPAGTVNPLAVETMKEHGTDISGQYSKSLKRFVNQRFDYVITVCDDANQECPVFPGPHTRLHWSTPDPSFVNGGDEDRKQAFRVTIGLLEKRIKDLLREIGKGHQPVTRN